MLIDTLIQEWNLSADLYTKEAILAALAARIQQMLATDPIAFIQAMYRLDIPETQLDAAMDAPDAAQVIAMLVWDRQLQKQLLREATPPRADDDEATAW